MNLLSRRTAWQRAILIIGELPLILVTIQIRAYQETSLADVSNSFFRRSTRRNRLGKLCSAGVQLVQSGRRLALSRPVLWRGQWWSRLGPWYSSAWTVT